MHQQGSIAEAAAVGNAIAPTLRLCYHTQIFIDIGL
jgi:hypothetical protein